MHILIFVCNTYAICRLYRSFRIYHFTSYAMEFIHFVNLIFILIVNILFFIPGICLNSLVIVSFWRSVQLRKKLCYFTIMILSCCDLLVVLTTHPVTALTTMLWLTEKITVYPGWLMISHHVLPNTFFGFSLVALLVMSLDRYLATHYPIFHRTSVTKGKLLTLFAFLVIIVTALVVMSINDLVIPHEVGLLICLIIYIPPMLFINYKLFRVASKSRKNNGISPEMKKSNSFKNISSCLLVVACLILMSTPFLVYIVLRRASKETRFTLNDPQITGLWGYTACNRNELNIQLFNFLLEKQDFARRGKESY